MLSTVRKTATLIGKRQWRRWLLLVVLALVVSGFEMLGAALVYVLVTVVSSPSGPVELPVVGDLRELVSQASEQALLVSLVVGLTVFFAVRAVVRIGTTYAQARVAYNAGARLSSRLTAAYLNAPYAFHLRRNSSELIRNSHVAVNQVVNDVFLPIIRISSESIIVLGLLTVMLTIAPVASLVAAGVVGLSAGLLLLMVQPRLRRLGRVAHISNNETLSFLQQSLHGIRDVKVFGREGWFAKAYASGRRRMARAFYLRNTLTEVPRTLIELSLIGFILVYFGVTLVVEADTPATVSVLGLFAYVGLRLQPSIQKIVAGLNSLKFAKAPLDELDADLSHLESESADESSQALPFNVAITLDNVSFKYEGAHAFALRNLTLQIDRGQEIGICGPTGGGKTTLVDVISGLLQPTSGRVVVDGTDIREDIGAWRRNLGVVPQDVFLLDETLRRNIAFGVAEREIDEDAVQEAVDLAQLREFVESLPDGLEASVGERGIRLSGGQRQRIAIARALYHRPQVLIFDEGTSALDNDTEAALMNAIDGLRGRHTIILVAHRLSTVRNCDRVLLVERGRIVAEGPFDKVMRRAQ